MAQTRAFEEVILQIEEAIIDGRLAVGDKLPPEREIASMLKVSRPSVREALRVLEAFGVVSARRGTGPSSGSILSTAGNSNGLANLLRVNASLLHVPLADLLEMREAIETWTARNAAKRATPQDIRQLTAIVDRMQGRVNRKTFLELDTEFHITVAAISGNAIAPLLMEALRGAIAHQMKRAFDAIEDWETERDWLVKEHSRLLASISSRSEDKAAEAVSQHIRGFYGRVLRDADRAEAGNGSKAKIKKARTIIRPLKR